MQQFDGKTFAAGSGDVKAAFPQALGSRFERFSGRFE